MGKNRRRGAVVTNDDEEAQTSMLSVPAPPLDIDIFSKFQNKRGDLDPDWVLMQDDEPPSTAPLSDAVKQRLQENQALLHKQRRREQEEAEAEAEAETEAAAKKSVKSSSEVSSSDGEYDPREERVAAQHNKDSSEAGGEPRKEKASRPGGGIGEEFLSFAKANEDVVRTEELQATLTFPNATTSSSSSSKRERRRGGRGDDDEESSHYRDRHGERDGRGSSPTTTYSVPLWSARRMREWGGYNNRYPTIALHQEICDLLDFLRPTQAEVSVRRFIEMEIRRMAKKLWPESDVVVYGSLSTHLLLPLSDVDMTVYNVPVSTEEALPLLAKEIDAAKFTNGQYPQVILKTKVPLVKFQHAGSLIDVDISIGAMDGMENTRIVNDLLDTFPEAKPLILLIKYFLQQRDVDEPYRGGLGSYATTLLVISFLQHHPIYTTHPEQRPRTGLGKLLVDFFRYFGLYWNYNRCGVSLRDGGRYKRRNLNSPYQPNSPSFPRYTNTGSPNSPLGPTQVEVEDPGNPENNATSSLRQFHVISSFFTHAYCSLTACDMPLPTSSTTTQPISPDAQDIALRPTLLSRILHVDPESLQRRRLIEAAYQKLRETMPERMEEVKAYRREEDWPMIHGVGRRHHRDSNDQQHHRGVSLSSGPASSNSPFPDTTLLDASTHKYFKKGMDETPQSLIDRLRSQLSPLPVTPEEKLSMRRLTDSQAARLEREKEEESNNNNDNDGVSSEEKYERRRRKVQQSEESEGSQGRRRRWRRREEEGEERGSSRAHKRRRDDEGDSAASSSGKFHH